MNPHGDGADFGSAKGSFDIIFEPDLKLSEEQENVVNEFWENESNNQRFDGPAVVMMRPNGDSNRATLSSYRLVHYLLSASAVRSDLSVYWPLGVSALVETAGGIVVGQRNSLVAHGKTRWEFAPAGVLAGHNMHEQVFEELEEELGIPRTEIIQMSYCGLAVDEQSRIFDAVFHLHTSLNSSEVLRAHKTFASREYSEIEVVPRSSMSKFLTRLDVLSQVPMKNVLRIARIDV